MARPETTRRVGLKHQPCKRPGFQWAGMLGWFWTPGMDVEDILIVLPCHWIHTNWGNRQVRGSSVVFRDSKGLHPSPEPPRDHTFSPMKTNMDHHGRKNKCDRTGAFQKRIWMSLVCLGVEEQRSVRVCRRNLLEIEFFGEPSSKTASFGCRTTITGRP